MKKYIFVIFIIIILVFILLSFSSCARYCALLYGNPYCEFNQADVSDRGYPIFYVSSEKGDDNNLGTIYKPVKTIQAAINLINNAHLKGVEIYVAKGVYEFNSQEQNIEIKGTGFFLTGGFNETFERRYPSAYSIIVDNSPGGFFSSSLKIVDRNWDNDEQSQIEGFWIQGGNATYSTSVYVENATPIIKNCIIKGGSGEHSFGVYAIDAYDYIYGEEEAGERDKSKATDYDMIRTTLISNKIEGGNGKQSYGVYNAYSPLIIRNNIIDGGLGNLGSYGIKNSNLDIIEYNQAEIDYDIVLEEAIEITGNDIIGGGSVNGSYGIYDYNTYSQIINNVIISSSNYTVLNDYGIYETEYSVSDIFNNTIYANIGDESTCIYIENESHPAIMNNILYGKIHCHEGDEDSDPCEFYSNNLSSCDSDPATIEFQYIDEGTDIISSSTTAFDIWTDEDSDFEIDAGELYNVPITDFDNDPSVVEFINIYGKDGSLFLIEDNNWHLTDNPLNENAKNNGYNLSEYFIDGLGLKAVDKLGIERATNSAENWSMGAYSVDEPPIQAILSLEDWESGVIDPDSSLWFKFDNPEDWEKYDIFWGDSNNGTSNNILVSAYNESLVPYFTDGNLYYSNFETIMYIDEGINDKIYIRFYNRNTTYDEEDKYSVKIEDFEKQLTLGEWKDGEIMMPGDYMIFKADTVANNTYSLYWNDGFIGDGSYTCDVVVSVCSYNEDYEEIYHIHNVDSAYVIPQEITAISSEMYIIVQSYDSEDVGTFSVFIEE